MKDHRRQFVVVSKTTYSKAKLSCDILGLELNSPYLLEPDDEGYIIRRIDSNKFKFILKEKLEYFLGLNVLEFMKEGK